MRSGIKYNWSKNEFVPLIVMLANLFTPKHKGLYVEIGVGNGQTIRAMLDHTTGWDIVAVDINPDMLNNLPDDNRLQKFHGVSSELAVHPFRPFDLLFIDANHRKEFVWADFNVLKDLVRVGTGLILLHDTHPANEELLRDDRSSNAWEVANQLHFGHREFEIVTLPGPRAGL